MKEDIHIPRFELIEQGKEPTRCEGALVVYQGNSSFTTVSHVLAPNYPVEVLNLENEYEIDSEDEEFLEDLRKRNFVNKDGTEFVVDDEIFEVIIDHLEKQSFDEVLPTFFILTCSSASLIKL